MTRSKELAQKNIFYSVVLSFKVDMFSLHVHTGARKLSPKRYRQVSSFIA